VIPVAFQLVDPLPAQGDTFPVSLLHTIAIRYNFMATSPKWITDAELHQLSPHFLVIKLSIHSASPSHYEVIKTNVLYAILITNMNATCPALCNLFNLTTLKGIKDSALLHLIFSTYL
jgi:hypothetical protein